MAGSEQLAAVREVIQSYIDACSGGDVLALRALFHPSAILSGYLAGELVTGSPEPFFNAVAANSAPANSGLRYEARIDAVNIDGRIATAVLTETGYLGMDFVNHFQLLEVDGQWHIVAKLFESQ